MTQPQPQQQPQQLQQMESITGNIYYKFDIIDEIPTLKTFTIEENLELYPDSPLQYYATKENYKQHESDKSKTKNTFCDKYIDDGCYEDLIGAMMQIDASCKYYSDIKAKSIFGIKGTNNEIYLRMLKIRNSEIFQQTRNHHPEYCI